MTEQNRQDATIGKAAQAAGVGVETIRFYERRGLIEQPLKGNGHRVYTPEIIERIRFIRRAQQIGFSLRETEEILQLRSDPAADCADVWARAERKVEDIDRRITDLQEMKAALKALADICPGTGGLQDCTILDALDPPASRSNQPGRQSASPSQFEGTTMESITINVSGMRCGACVAKVKAILLAQPGVHAAEVSLDPAGARVLYDPQTTDVGRLTLAIEKPGYSVVASQAG